MAERSALDADRLDLLQDAFRCFDQAAESLQDTYRALTARVEQLDLELTASNQALRANLKENEEIKAHLAAILESLATGVIVTGPEGRILRCNESAERMLDLRREEMLGEQLPDVRARVNLSTDTYPVLSPHGVPLAVSQSVLKDAHGLPAGEILLLHDVSAVRGLEAQLQRRDRLAAMGEMVGRIAHEIRNPLGSIELFASMLRKDDVNEADRRRYAQHISVAVQAMDRLLANLLAYARPDCSRKKRHRLRPLVEEAGVLAAHETTRLGIGTQVDIDDDLALWCDGSQMQQALLNLSLNAAHAMPNGGILAIVATRECTAAGVGSVRIVVSDTGVGIPPSDLSRVCDPFYSTREDGTGLGLAIVHAIVEAHGGRLVIESEVGRGTKVTMIIPDRREQAGARSPVLRKAL